MLLAVVDSDEFFLFYENAFLSVAFCFPVSACVVLSIA